MGDPTTVSLAPKGRKWWVLGLALLAAAGGGFHAYRTLARYQTVYRVVQHGDASDCGGETVTYNDGQGDLLGRKETLVIVPWQSKPIALGHDDDAWVRASITGPSCDARLECFIRIDDREAARKMGNKSVSCETHVE